MDFSPQAGYLFSLPQLPFAFYSSNHKICYPKATALSIQFVLTYLLPLPFAYTFVF
jgi:hypothetical protein